MQRTRLCLAFLLVAALALAGADKGSCDPDPLTPVAQRWAYLKKFGVLGLYVDYQYKLVAEQARTLREKVDAINPEFQIGVYAWGVLLEAVKENVATARSPVLDISAMTYGRTVYSREFEGGYNANEPDRTGLKWSLVTAAKMARAARRRSYPAVMLAGHYAQASGPADGTQYRFTARQAFNSAAYADGYWIWTDWHVPKPWKSKQEWIDAMMAYFGQANAALDAGDFSWSGRQADQIPDPKATKPLTILTTGGKQTWAWDPITGSKAEVHSDPDIKRTPAEIDGKRLRINGHDVEVVDPEAKTVLRKFRSGHGVRAVAVGEVDGLPGREIVTLNAGWIKIWDPDSGVMLLRFHVGGNQKRLQLGRLGEGQ